MPDAVGRRVEVAVEISEAEISAEHASSRHGDRGAKQIIAPQRIREGGVRVYVLRFQSIDEVYVSRVDVHLRHIQVRPLVADIRQFDDGVSERLEGEREVPVLRVWNMPAVWPCVGDSRDCDAVQEKQSIRRNAQRLVERDPRKSRRVARQSHWLGRIARAYRSASAG